MRPVFPNLVLTATILLSGAMAQPERPLSIVQAQGRAEVRHDDRSWRPLATMNSQKAKNQDPKQGLRTGVGRVQMRSAQGSVLVGSRSQLRVYKNKPDLQKGRFFLKGPISIYVLGHHIVMETKGSFRVDLDENGRQRIAVLNSQLRISGTDGIKTISKNQQIHLSHGKITSFSEKDSWYLSQFTGVGNAQIEGLHGTVFIKKAKGQKDKPAKLDMFLSTGDHLQTQKKSWAEIGFEGGGYLRLAEKSTLKVLSIERTSKGREVVIRLLEGSAWNVVQKGAGGYRITTPVISTAVRGTTFRVDATGLVKVLDGKVDVPADNNHQQSELSLDAGQQKPPKKKVEKLVLDSQDKWNISLDKERNEPIQLNIERPSVYTRSFNIYGQVLPNTQVTTQIYKNTHFMSSVLTQPIQFTSTGTYNDFHWRNPQLPEGYYHTRITAKRYGQYKTWQENIIIDRTPPTMNDIHVHHRGRILTLKLTVHDNQHKYNWLRLRLQTDGKVSERWISGWSKEPYTTQLIFPAAQNPNHIALTLIDRAGNEAYVRFR